MIIGTLSNIINGRPEPIPLRHLKEEGNQGTVQHEAMEL
jgi:hypothetical protein